MPDEEQHGAGAGQLLVEPRVAIGRRGMGPFDRFSPRKSTSALRDWRSGRGIEAVSAGVGSGWSSARGSGPGGSPGSSSCGVSPAFGWKLLIDAEAFTSLPSTEKRSAERSGGTGRWARIAVITLRDMSVVSSRSRFLLETMGTQTGSSPPSLTNYRNSRLYYICSISCRSEQTENRVWISLARISRSGGIEGRP